MAPSPPPISKSSTSIPPVITNPHPLPTLPPSSLGTIQPIMESISVLTVPDMTSTKTSDTDILQHLEPIHETLVENNSISETVNETTLIQKETSITTNSDSSILPLSLSQEESTIGNTLLETLHTQTTVSNICNETTLSSPVISNTLSDVTPIPIISSEQLRNTISSLQKDVADREKRISALETAAATTSRQNLERERAATAAFAEERKRAATASAALLSASREETKRVTDRMLVLEKELLMLRTRLSEDASMHSLAIAEATSEKTRQVQAIKTELEAALLRGEAFARNEAAANSVAAKLRDESNEAKLETARAQEEARNLKVQLAAAALATSNSEAAAIKNQETAAELERSVNALRVERDDLRAAFSTKQAQAETMQQRAQVETEAADLRREIVKEREAVSRHKVIAETAELKVIELEKKIIQLEKKIEQLNPKTFEEKIGDLQRQVAAAKESEESAVGEKNAANKKYDSVRKDLQRLTAGESGDALKRISIDELKRAKDKLDIKLVKLSEENAALKDELEVEKLKVIKGVQASVLTSVSLSTSGVGGGSGGSVGNGSILVKQPPTIIQPGISVGSGLVMSSKQSMLPLSSQQLGGISGVSSSSSGNNNSTMISQLQVLINQLTSDVQEKDEQLQQQKSIKEGLATTLREQANRIQDLEHRLGEKSW
jgi:hypothetical protein